MGVSGRKRASEVDKKFEASAIGSWLELWRLILCYSSKSAGPLRQQTSLDVQIFYCSKAPSTV